MDIINKTIESETGKKYMSYILSLIPYRIRVLNKSFHDFFQILVKNEAESFEKMKEYQFNKMKQTVYNAYHFTNFYKKKYDRYSFHPDMLKSEEDIKKIPPLTKEEVRTNGNEMVPAKYRKNFSLLKSYTSGTTGKPLTLYRNYTTSSRELAAIFYQWIRIGFSPGDGRIQFRGFLEHDRLYTHVPDQKVLRINTIKMNNQNLHLIVKKIIKTNYKYFHGYPSALYKFSRLLDDANIELKPEAILIASEVLYDWQMKLIDHVFPSSKKIAHYGQAEKVALGAWTDRRKYSFIPSYGYLEHDKTDHEIIATGFINNVMPLIRYKMNDSISGYSPESLESKPMLFPVIDNIIGRQEDYVYDVNGNLIPPAIVTFPFKKCKQIRASKIIQDDLDNINLIIEGTEREETIAEIEYLKKEFAKMFGHINIKYKIVDEIPVDQSGKFKWIESKVKEEISH